LPAGRRKSVERQELGDVAFEPKPPQARGSEERRVEIA